VNTNSVVQGHDFQGINSLVVLLKGKNFESID
jgi:hypothetical protein